MPVTNNSKRTVNRLKLKLNDGGAGLIPNGGVSKLISILSKPAARKKTAELAHRANFNPSKMSDELKHKAWKGKNIDDMLEELH